MSHRQEEKERRRAERVAREQAERAAAARRRRLQMVFGGLLAAAAVAGVLIAVFVALGGDDEEGASAAEGDLPALPAQQISDLQDAAEAAGCTLTNPKYEGQTHEDKDFKPSDYKTNPPTSGNHTPTYYQDGIYAPGTVPDLGMLVHTLEHGRINVQYKPGTDEATVKKLQAFLAENSDGYHMLLYENTTGMEEAVAATAWTHKLGCPTYNDKVPDALRAFRARYIDKGPETVA